MRKVRISFTVLMAVFIFGAVAASASAAELYVNHEPLKAKPAETINSVMYAAETEGIVENVPITSGYLEVEGKTVLICLKLHVVDGLMKAPNTVTAKEAVFLSCKETLHSGCALASSTIKMFALKGTASTLASPKAELSVEPQSGSHLAEIAYATTNPAPCYKATELLTGHFIIVGAEGQNELSTQIGNVNSAAGELELNGERAFERIGQGEVTIVSGHTFSFH